MASGWQDRRDWLMEITGGVNDWLVQKAGPQPGQTILDIAAGTGDLGFHAAERMGPQGRVISTDFSPEMLDVARRFGEARGLTNVEYRVLDAESMDLDDDSVDGVALPVRLHADGRPATALKETRRRRRPVAFGRCGDPDRNPGRPSPG